jgi:flagellar biosynthesis anti-sigma factor FlgM
VKIELNPSSTPELAKSSGSATVGQPGKATTTASAGQAEDTASLSTGSDVVASLRAQLESVPDVRQDRVQSLREAISQGQFVVSPGQVAAGMLAEAGFA